MKDKFTVSAVSYTNMLPFIHGLKHYGLPDKAEMVYDVPSACAEKLIHQQADIGIVPVAALLDIPSYEIISDYCLGADGAVDSVFIFSEKPIHEIKTLRLDDQSRSSNGLARLLLKEYWGMDQVRIVREGSADAFVQIGDRTFGHKDRHAFAYDLAWHWKEFTGLPFAFAVWVSVTDLPEGFVDKFNRALAFGLEHREEVIQELGERPDFDYGKYLRENISYELDDSKKRAIDKYLAWMRANEGNI